LALDPRTGGFSSSSGSTGTPIEFPDPRVTVELGLHLTGPGGTMDDGWRVILHAPSLRIRMPFLRGAMLDSFGHLRFDAANPIVRFTLPALRVRVQQLSGAAVGVDLLSATTAGPAVDQVYEFIRMEPPYALVGPSDTVGFAFRTAVLDLSGTAGPSGVPAGARAMPSNWQGLFLPDVRLFVAPEGLDGLSVMAGVENLWIGIGVHEGVTGLFEAEVVNRGHAPAIVVRFVTEAGQQIGFTGDSAQLPEHTTVYAESSGGLGAYDVSITVNGVRTDDDRAPVTTPPAGSISVVVALTAVGGGPVVTTRTITVSRSATPVTAGASGTPVTVRTTSSEAAYLVLVEPSTPTSARVRLSSGAAATWAWPGGTITGTEAEVPVAQGATVAVTAVTTAGQVQTLDAYYLFDRPKVADGDAYAVNPANTHIGPATDRTHHSASALFIDHARTRLSVIGAATQLTVSGFASYEGDSTTAQEQRNRALSARRRDGMIAALRSVGYTNVVAGSADGTAAARAGTSIDGQPAPAAGSASWWRARAVSADPPASITVTGELTRPAPTPPARTDPTPTRSQPPDCFHKIGVRVELVRSTFVRCEIYGEFDIETATEASLRRRGQPALRSGPRNAADGVCTFLVRLRIAEDQGAWEVSGEFRAKEGDLDGLAEMTDSNANQVALDILGALSILAPLSASATELSPAAGAVVALGSIALGASDLLHTHRLTLRGAEIIVSQGILGADGITTVSQRGTQVTVLVDIEAAFSFDLTLVRVDPAHPIVTRYKAIGLRSSWDTVPAGGGGVDYVPLPVFFPDRGYTLDIPAGSLTAAPPLDNILRILGVRVSRDNPTYLEVEVGLGLDLGVITIETVRVRARVDGPPLDLQLTKFGASVDIPNVITGRGYLSFETGGFSGSFDLQIIPLKLRASASLAVRQAGGVTGVLLGIEVEFPVPLVLGSSGLGLFGILAGVGINHGRVEDPSAPVPALKWLQDQFARPGGVMDPAGWSLQPGHYAFAAGVLLGTLEGGYIVHLKGIVLIEVPGPRLLFVLKADLIKAPPAFKSNQSATFLAVLDLDFGRGTITIGVVAAYEIESILTVRVPVTAFFSTQQVQNWFVDLGTYTDRVTVSVLDVISGSGYLMIHGNGVAIPGLPAVSSGLGIATGFHISAVLMGSKAIGLYLEVAAGFDAIVGFDPFFIAGKIYARGELRLFIISIGASAELTVMVGKRVVGGVVEDQPYVHGKVCGSIDLFFFEIKGCVSLTIGSEPDDDPAARPLVAGVSLVSRSPALVEGSGTGRAIDGKLGDALDTTAPAAPLITVPLDAFPVITFDAAPTVGPNAVMGANALGQTGAGANPWTRIGERWWRYEVLDVQLTGALIPATGGKTPSSWWTGRPPGQPVPTTALALLNWLPTPFSRAIPYGEELIRSVRDRWGTVCHPAAPSAPLLWTFADSPWGPNPPGWLLDGIAWPDPPETVRSAPAQGRLQVTEPWRIPERPDLDVLQGTEPARVIGDHVPCTKRGGDTPTRAAMTRMTTSLARDLGTGPSAGSSAFGEAAYGQAMEALATGTSLGDLAAHHATTAWAPETTGAQCRGAILRSPVDDVPEPAPHGSPLDRDIVKRGWADSGFKPDDLRDAVRLTPSEPALELSALLLVPTRALEGGIILRVEDPAGNEILQRPLTGADVVGTGNPLPPALTDPNGPWFDPTLRAARIGSRILADDKSYAVVWVSLRKLDAEIGSVVIGWREGAFGGKEEPSVLRRRGHRSPRQRGLAGVVGHDDHHRGPRRPAELPHPGPRRPRPAEPRNDLHGRRDLAGRLGQTGLPAGSDTTPDWQANETQSYRFATEPVPALADRPRAVGARQRARDGRRRSVLHEPVRIALAHQQVADLFGAYGKELRVVVRSASGKHPAPPDGGAARRPRGPCLSRPSEFLAPALALKIADPVERGRGDDAPDVGDLPCIDISGTKDHTVTITLPYTFEPLTDYLIDVHAVPVGAPASATGLVHRIPFTTSRFDVAGRLRVLHRAGLGASTGSCPARRPSPRCPRCSRPAIRSTRHTKVLGLAVSATTPRSPRSRCCGPATPCRSPMAIIVIESSEPLWRSRIMPQQVTGPDRRLRPTAPLVGRGHGDWLSLAPSTDAGRPPNLPSRRSPGSSLPRTPRAVVLPRRRGARARGPARPRARRRRSRACPNDGAPSSGSHCSEPPGRWRTDDQDRCAVVVPCRDDAPAVGGHRGPVGSGGPRQPG
jgi:hypothetical protein